MKYKGTIYGVWVDYTEGKLYISYDYDPSSKIVYTITLDDHTPNTLLLKRPSSSSLFKTFVDGYKLGVVYFESMNIKNIVYEIIRLTLI